MAWHLYPKDNKFRYPVCGCTKFDRSSIEGGGLYEIHIEENGLTDVLFSGWETSEYEYKCHQCRHILTQDDLQA